MWYWRDTELSLSSFSTVIFTRLGSGSERERERERERIFYVIYGERQIVTWDETVGRCCDDNERPLNP